MFTWRRLGRLFLQIVLPAAIIAAVGWQFYQILTRPELRKIEYSCRIEWLLPAGLLYLMAHTIWASFWVTLLRHQGFHATFATGLRAYFISQYGKYIPGKVWVILIRVAMLGANGRDRATVGVTATYEALTAMASGAILGAILLPLVNINLPLNFGAQHQFLIAIAAIPLGVGLLHRLVVRIARKKLGPDAHLPNMNLLLLFRGLLQDSLGWLLLGLSLWMVIQAIRPEVVPLTGEDLIRLTAINCLSYVLGFIILIAPAGGGVREWVLGILVALELSSSMPLEIAEGYAVVIAIVVRLVWTMAEVILALSLYRFIPSWKRTPLLPAVKELAT